MYRQDYRQDYTQDYTQDYIHDYIQDCTPYTAVHTLCTIHSTQHT